MGIPEPQNFRASLTPIMLFNWLIGMGIFQKPKFKFIYVMMILYSVGFWILFIVGFYIGIRAMPQYFYDNAPMAIVMYKALVYTNTCVAIITPFLGWVRSKTAFVTLLLFQKFNDYIDRVEKLDDTFARILGFDKNYKKLAITQIYVIITISSIIVLINITDALWVPNSTSLFTKIALMFTFHHPILLMLVTDSTFCGGARTLGKRFGFLNTALLSLAESDVASYPRGRLIVAARTVIKSTSSQGIGNNETRNSANKRYVFQTIRKSHLELSKLTMKLNSVFGIQNLISMAVSSVMITGLLYTIYSDFNWEGAVRKIIEEVMSPATWCVIYASKIFIISYTSASVSDEAQKSGQIIYELLGSASDKEFQKEIQEFALQMIQNPVRFTACGFFTLDHAYIQGVIGSITTYLVILIQMSTSPTSTPSVNKTAA